MAAAGFPGMVARARREKGNERKFVAFAVFIPGNP